MMLAAVAALLAVLGGASPAPGGIDLRDIVRGVVPRDAIPALVLPRFDGVADAAYMRDDDRVVAVTVGDDARAYPERVLDHHEIVDDIVGGKPLAVTYCPLCGSAVAFVPQVDGQSLTFGVSGDLLDSNLLMYDHETGSEWSQILGMAVEGPLAGKRLAVYPVAYDTWARWKAAHPHGLVLSIHTPYEDRFDGYKRSPYEAYDSTQDIWYYAGRDDTRLARKARIIGVEVHDAYKAYREDDVWRAGVIEDHIADVDVVLIADRASSHIGLFRRGDRHFALRDGAVVDDQGRAWTWADDQLTLGDDVRASFPVLSTYWFAWSALHPGAQL